MKDERNLEGYRKLHVCNGRRKTAGGFKWKYVRIGAIEDETNR